MENGKYSDFYICSSVPDGGILHFVLTLDGKTELKDTLSLPSPNYLVIEGKTAYATLSKPFPGSSECGVVKLGIGENGELFQDGEIIPTGGESSCHLCFEGNDLYVANYSSGSVTKIGREPLLHEGHGPNAKRQEKPHCHCTFFSPDKKYVLVCDLGLDTVFVYDRDLNEISKAKVPDGAGCRHLTFSKDGKFVYVENELGSSVSAFSWNDGQLLYKTTIETRTYVSHEGDDKGSAIKLSKDGKRLYVTNRGENQVVTLSVKGDKMKVIGRADTLGDEPRDFSLLLNEKFGLVTNQFGNSAVLYKVGGLRKNKLSVVRKYDIPAAICVTELAK